jgi:hypothetical protein
MHPTTIEADVMKPVPVDGPFDSVALNYVLHCNRKETPRSVACPSVVVALCRALLRQRNRRKRGSGAALTPALSRENSTPFYITANYGRSATYGIECAAALFSRS